MNIPFVAYTIQTQVQHLFTAILSHVWITCSFLVIFLIRQEIADSINQLIMSMYHDHNARVSENNVKNCILSSD